MARVFAELHTAHGVDLRMGAGVSEIHGDGARVSSVTLSDGDTVPADAVVAGVGIRPAVELVEVAGLSVDNDVLVNAALRTSDPDISAAGDVANPTPAGPTDPGGALGQRAARRAAAAGPCSAMTWSTTGCPSSATSTTSAWSTPATPGRGITTRSSCAATSGPRSPRSGWRAVAGMNVNIWGVTDDIQRVIRSQTTLDPTGLADPDVALSEL
jgi:3-phenylpropionate/trans-cinnamate dioxygenase ferredoxin reductase component